MVVPGQSGRDELQDVVDEYGSDDDQATTEPQPGVPETDDSDADNTEDTTDYEGVTGKVREHLRVNVEEGEQVTAPSVAGKLAGSDTPGQVKDALNNLATKGLLEKTGGGMYKLL